MNEQNPKHNHVRDYYRSATAKYKAGMVTVATRVKCSKADNFEAIL